MGYKELVQDLIQTAGADRDRILSRSREEARDIVRRAMEEAERIQLKNQEDLEKEVSGALERKKREGDKDLRMFGLQNKKEWVEAVLQRLEEKLRALPGSRGYSDLARRLFGELKEGIGDRTLLLRADSYAKKGLQTGTLPKGWRIEKLPDEEWGGVEAVLRDGRICLKNTLRSRYLKNQENIYLELGRWVEGDDGPELS